MNNYLKVCSALLEKAGMSDTKVVVEEANDLTSVTFSTYNSKGEDVEEEFCIQNKCKNFLKQLCKDVHNRADGYDLEEYIYMWVQAKRNGVAGVPDVDDLLSAGHENKAWLYQISKALEKEEKNEY